MRDVERTDTLIKLLEEFWKQNTDLRLGQILSIASSNRDIFYFEDTEVIKRLQDKLNK